MTRVNPSKANVAESALERYAGADAASPVLRAGNSERAVLVAVAFTESRRRLTATANLARKAAALQAAAESSRRALPEDGAEGKQTRSVDESAELDFDASLA